VAADPGWLDALAWAVKGEDAGDIALAIGLLSVGAAVAGWRAYHYLNLARVVEDIPTSKARSAHQGYVELEGAGRPVEGAPLVAPLSGLPCLWYRYKIEEQVTVHDHRGNTQSQWQTVEQGESHETFWLEDDSGRVLIDPDDAEITPKHKDNWGSRSGLAGTPLLPSGITQFMLGRAGTNPHRFTEERIINGDPLYALGLLKNLGSHHNAPTVEDETRELLREWKTDHGKLKTRFDLDKDGKINQKEWMLARSQARREALAARRKNPELSEGINILTTSGDRHRPYLLSSFRQSELVKRYRLWKILYALGSFVAGSAALWLFNARFG
jgi:hypothetical protein